MTNEQKTGFTENKPKNPLLGIIVGFVLIVIISNVYSTYKSQSIRTDKSTSNATIEGNLYKNSKYQFSIEFPEDWELSVGGSPSIVQKAVKDFSTISVGVRELGQKQINTISDIQTLEEFKNEQYGAIEKNYEDTELLDFGEKDLSGKKAYWLLTTNPYKVDGENKYHKAYFIATVSNGTYYFLSVSAPIAEYDEQEPILMDSVNSFTLSN